MRNVEEIWTVLLQNRPGRWKKADWKLAATILAEQEPPGFIQGVMWENARELLVQHIQKPNRRPGRPPRVDVERTLAVVESRRRQIADERGLDVAKITDMEVARSLASGTIKQKLPKGRHRTTESLTKEFSSHIKYAKVRSRLPNRGS